MASAAVNCSPKTFSPRVLIHRTDYNGLANPCRRGKPNMAPSRRSCTTSPLNVEHDNTMSITKTEPVNFELRNTESDRKQLSPERIRSDRDALKMRRDFHLNRRLMVEQSLAIESGPNAWTEAQMMSQPDPPTMKYLCKCCKCSCNGLFDSCLQQPKDARDFRTILPQIFRINDEHICDKTKVDSLRWTLYNSGIVNKNLLNLNCNGTTPFGRPIWSNRWIYPDLETYAHHLLKEDIVGSSKESNKPVTSVANNTASSISSCLAKTLPIAIGNACYNTCDGNNANRLFWPLISRNSTVLPVPSCTTSLSFTIPSPSSSSSSPPPSSSSSSSSPSTSPSSSTSSSMSSVCLFRRESFFSYDRKPLLCDGFGSSGLVQAKLKRYPSEGDDFTGPNKRFKYSNEEITAEHDHFDVPFVNSVTTTHGAGTTKTTSIYKVPNDSVNEKRQILKTKNFHCPFCNISCSNRGQLQGHVRIHTGERPFVCQEAQCGKAFIRNEELTRHRRIHTGERPHICPTCKKGFTRKDHLNKHMKTHT